jgi:hypothetical protein
LKPGASEIGFSECYLTLVKLFKINSPQERTSKIKGE